MEYLQEHDDLDDSEQETKLIIRQKMNVRRRIAVNYREYMEDAKNERFKI